VPLDQSNLIWRAAETLWRSIPPERSGCATSSSGSRSGFPLQAGLGGGSADAAARCIALAACRRVPSKPSQLTDLAAHIGSDVPFFLSGGTALGLGRGEEVYPLATCRVTGSSS
jgi:4-diphosphocytidyl-2-C-methyl-D-erythritol kinase